MTALSKIPSLALFVLALGLLALLTPLRGAESPPSAVGWLLAIAAAVEMLHALRRATPAARRRAAGSAIISLLIAIFLINAPFVATQALRILVAGWFGLDAIRYAIRLVRPSSQRDRRADALATLGNAAVTALLLAARGWLLTWAVSIAGALRIFGIAWNILTAPTHTVGDADETVIEELGLADDAAAVAIAAEVEAAELARGRVDRGWTIGYIATLFAIHMGRMQTEATFLGAISPAVAVLGDMVLAVMITFLVIMPSILAWRGPTRWIERRIWRWHLDGLARSRTGWLQRAADGWLRFRLAIAIRIRTARYSIPAALSRGLQAGLPIAAVIAATVPIWGMSWYFDTENWAAGMWNSWAESRTDSWREAMIRAVVAREGGSAGPSMFAVQPEGVATGDFSFIVIGDTGEGDASQHVLRDQLLAVAGRPDVRFVVISSDVVYPTGAMKDYEAKFWLPFKGVTKPVYAIPGNHDWYDALEAFAVTFLTPDAARASVRARAEADLRITSTTDARIESLIQQADHLRQAYRVPTGFQAAPFFEVQAEGFALIAIDTGVLRQIDATQRAWLESALERAAGKFIMAIPGHPFFAGGYDTTAGDASFSRLKALLMQRGVAVVMAGDTHDFEYYAEPDASRARTVHHFVNGGGGAYLSFGTSLAWPAMPPTTDWAYYPNRDVVTQKIETETPWWKRPAWWWTTAFGAWPFSAEWLSAAFDYNVAPFFQSFVEVKVERSTNRVRVVPYGIHGRLTWGDLAVSPRLRPAGKTDQDEVEWAIPMASPR